MCVIFLLENSIHRALHKKADEQRNSKMELMAFFFPCFFHLNESKWGLFAK